VNRHFDVLEAIRDAVDCELKLLVNEGCLYRCPFRYAHFNFFSHVNGPPPRPNVQDDYYYHKCLTMRINDPSQILKSPFIRPEDLKEYAQAIEQWKKHSTVCHTCGYCQRKISEIAQVYDHKGTTDEKLVPWNTITKKGIET
jgi:hypothetical protein